MRIPDVTRDVVAHLYEDVPDSKAKRPVGTAFGLGWQVEGGAFAPYLITARHIIYSVRSSSNRLYVRLNRLSGTGSIDVPVMPDDWTCHEETDVAAISFRLPSDGRLSYIGDDMLLTEDYARENDIGEGDDVFSAGLFSELPGRVHQQPVCRWGKIALRPYEPVSIRTEPGAQSPTALIEACLVEMHSWGGASGAPVFLYLEPTRKQKAPHPVRQSISLLGLIHGHYDIDSSVTFSGDIPYGQGTVGLNSGIAIVIPAYKITELLMRDEFVREREELARASIKTPTPDAIEAMSEPSFTKDDFEQALKKVARKLPDSGTTQTSDE